jgi:predicted phosphoribosyltransferase
MRAAAKAARQQQPARVVVAVPVGAADVCAEMRQEADEVVCAMTPPSLGGISAWYADFRQTSDDEVKHILAQASSEKGV